MLDILLDPNGDLHITENGDIKLTQSIRQSIRIRLLWFLNEWRFSPNNGIPYFEDMLIKHPNITRIRKAINNEILSISHIKSIQDLQIHFNEQTRGLKINFKVITDKETYNEELIICTG